MNWLYIYLFGGVVGVLRMLTMDRHGAYGAGLIAMMIGLVIAWPLIAAIELAELLRALLWERKQRRNNERHE